MMLTNVGTMPDYKTARDANLIESNILPLTEGLIKAGALPLSSCGGHWYNFLLMKRIERDPFVTFSSTIDFAKIFNSRIEYYAKYDAEHPELTLPTFYYLWYITGLFVDDHLVWHLKNNDKRFSNGKATASEECVKHDFKNLGKIAIYVGEDINAR